MVLALPFPVGALGSLDHEQEVVGRKGIVGMPGHLDSEHSVLWKEDGGVFEIDNDTLCHRYALRAEQARLRLARRGSETVGTGVFPCSNITDSGHVGKCISWISRRSPYLGEAA